ncbi:hypothetical protein BOX15_Mlig005355g1 [Macrostomum lignano]|uniref:Cadherin domain-containing protein n=1 Tax=Macrostomum lignano TaxID=282301 RepID=A0A267F7U9_9PLAT|nr:hypothetical protein BOX15_Mlig005355g1 [Macrostomum lignano]
METGATLVLLLLLLPALVRQSAGQVSAEPIQLALPDNVDFNAKVGDLLRLDPSLPAPDPRLGFHTTSLKADNPRLDGYFTLDSRGAVYARRNVDRDELCSAADCCESMECRLDFSVLILSTPGGREARRNLRIILADENDMRPTFPSLVPVELREDAPAPGPTGLRLTPADDGDGPANRVSNYSLLDPSGTFGLEVVLERLTNGSQSRVPVPYLTLLKALDRELLPQYQVTLVATDGVHSTSAVVTIRVGDVNDNAPVFEPNLMESSFPETELAGYEIRALTAPDKDFGENANVTFAIGSVNPPSLAEHFRVGSESGGLWVLFLARQLDFEAPEQRSAEVLVIASDQGSPPRSSTGTVRISVVDANDNKPVITELYSYNLEEHQPPRVLVKTLQVTDADQISVGRVNCRIESNNMFRLEPNGSGAKPGAQSERLTFSLFSATSFDYEMTQEELVTVGCIDNASPEKVTRVEYRVPIRETNDFGPVFDQRNYHVSVPEDLANGLTVQVVKAVDQDRDRFGEVHYELDEAGSANFSVDARSGRIEVRGRLDRETAESLRFTVTARDYGGKSDTATVVVVLTDVNDCSPLYTGPPAFQVVENSPPGTELGRVSFHDPDSGANGSVTFAMLSDTHNVANEFLRLFSNGSLVVAKPIDREAYAKFYVEIEARDQGRVSRSSTATVQVDVADVNDCAPVLEQPSPGSAVGSERTIVYTNLPPGSPILTVRGADRDLGDNGTVEYRLGASNASGLLSIGLDTGRLATAWDPETAPPAAGTYTVLVLMRDRGRPRQLSGRGEFQIRLTPPPGGGPLGRLGSAGFNGLVALVAIVVGTAVLATALLVAICRVRASGGVVGRGGGSGGGAGGARRRQLAAPTDEDEEAGLKAAAAAAAAASTASGPEASAASSTYYAWQHPGSPLGSMLRDGAEKQMYRPLFVPDCNSSLLLPMDQMGTACIRQLGCTSPRPGLQVYPSQSDVPMVASRQYHQQHQPKHERRRSDEEDAPSIHDSGRGGSVEDFKTAQQQQQQHHHQSHHPPMGTFTVPASVASRSAGSGSGSSGRRLARQPDTAASAGTMI